jgi:hypothetical protein
MSQSVIPHFSGRPIDFHSWVRAVRNLARTSSTSSNIGLLGFVLTPEEIAEIFDDPDNVPEAIVARPGPVPAIAAGADAFARYKLQRDVYILQQADLSAFTTIFLQSIDVASIDSIQDPDLGLIAMTVLDIMTAMRDLHGALSTSDVIQCRDSLRTTFDPATSSLKQLIADHARIHAQLASVGQDLSPFDQIQFLRESVAPCGIFDQRIILWYSEVPQLDDQVFRANPPAHNGLADALLLFDNLRDKTVVQSALSTRNTSTQPRASTGRLPSRQDSSARAQVMWCYHHGFNTSHGSSACRLRNQTGFHLDATPANPLGGNMSIYSPPAGVASAASRSKKSPSAR